MRESVDVSGWEKGSKVLGFVSSLPERLIKPTKISDALIRDF